MKGDSLIKWSQRHPPQIFVGGAQARRVRRPEDALLEHRPEEHASDHRLSIASWMNVFEKKVGAGRLRRRRVRERLGDRDVYRTAGSADLSDYRVEFARCAKTHHIEISRA